MAEPDETVETVKCYESTDHAYYYGEHPKWCKCEGTGRIAKDESEESK